MPNTRFTSAASKAAPNASRYDATTRGAVTVSQKPSHPRPALLIGKAASGINTSRLRYSTAYPREVPKPGRTPGRLRRRPAGVVTPAAAIEAVLMIGFCRGPLFVAGLVDLVERAAVAEMRLLRPLPAAEDRVVDGDQLHLGKLAGELGGHLLVGGPVVIAGDDLLGLRGVQELEVGLRRRARALAVDVLVHHRHRRLGQDRQRRDDDVELVGPEFLQGQERLVFPGQQHIADAALDKRGGGAARPG